MPGNICNKMTDNSQIVLRLNRKKAYKSFKQSFNETNGNLETLTIGERSCYLSSSVRAINAPIEGKTSNKASMKELGTTNLNNR